ncbi:STAS domain-containing protein [Herpetosiphon llansteffanensis]|uniref:STAS domain-containing protein n=1 Tax=Herpetosiphon llansteffanensis TaxID=2094568 RepID=UPI000D7C3A52|nr:STAS domain-containing protein [Herpetosiphon llansteffanensis]
MATDKTIGQSYRQIQQTLLNQILSTMVVSTSVVSVVMLIGLAFPQARTIPYVIMTLVAISGVAVIATSLYWIRQGHQQRGAFFFIMGCILLGAILAVVFNLPSFMGFVSIILIMVSAFLIGFRYTIYPLVVSVIILIFLAIADYNQWFTAYQFDNSATITFIVHTIAALSMLIVTAIIINMAVKRLEESADEAFLRARDAEEARMDQIALNDQLHQDNLEKQKLLDVIDILETPAIPILADTVVIPILGYVSDERLTKIQKLVLEHIYRERIQTVLVDITGVTSVDQNFAQGLQRLVQAIYVLGAKVFLTGIQPKTAHMFVDFDLHTALPETYATIADAIEDLTTLQSKK